MFFYSMRGEYVKQRVIWFGLAGLVEPEQSRMGFLVRCLSKYGSNVRRQDREARG